MHHLVEAPWRQPEQPVGQGWVVGQRQGPCQCHTNSVKQWQGLAAAVGGLCIQGQLQDQAQPRRTELALVSVPLPLPVRLRALLL